jgi:hypothetical protein
MGQLDVPKGFAGETTMKMTHEEVGIRRGYVLQCDTLDIEIQNLVHIQDLSTIQKCNKEIPYINSKRTSPMGHFLWDMRSHPKM